MGSQALNWPKHVAVPAQPLVANKELYCAVIGTDCSLSQFCSPITC